MIDDLLLTGLWANRKHHCCKAFGPEVGDVRCPSRDLSEVTTAQPSAEHVERKTVTGCQEEFANGNAPAGFDINAIAILDNPPSVGEKPVEIDPGTVFRAAAGWGGHEQFQGKSQDSAGRPLLRRTSFLVRTPVLSRNAIFSICPLHSQAFACWT
jgi:hypothetical protein